ncbi:hypothetical protein E2C01_085446 [Portunus trituberculatus]|uniref:Endonuclease/exonuclease/phosphatase domain-containing protein n=1 Tax=Portunus trituberculatus TaxID=210409 RepID=A0A5B7JBY5_PORTR|nr:hypothetical protein [Portunus trituberculatus]
MDNAGQWSKEVLQLTMINAMDQWVEESTRYRGEEEPSLLDLIFTKKPESPPIIKYLSPMGRSDHVTLEMKIQEEDGISYRGDYKGERLNYARVDFEQLRIYFADIRWRNIMYRKTVQGKYDIFLQKYNEGKKKNYIFIELRKKIHAWYNARYI